MFCMDVSEFIHDKIELMSVKTVCVIPILEFTELNNILNSFCLLL